MSLNRQLIITLFLCYLFPCFLGGIADATPLLRSLESVELNLSTYLCQVRESNEGLLAAYLAAEAASERSDEGELLFRPNFYAGGRHLRDRFPSFSSNGDEKGVQENEWNVGLSYQTKMGPQLVLEGSGDHITSRDGGSNIYSLQLYQPLWRNWLARETKAQAALMRSSALSTKFSKLYQVQVALAQAELLYWQLAITRETVKLQNEALERAQVLLDWQIKRSGKNLANEIDLLQAEAAVKGYQLDKEIALEQERQAASQFNSFRGICCSRVNEVLISLEDFDVNVLAIPCYNGLRKDLIGASYSVEALSAQKEIDIQRSYSQVDLFVSAARHDIHNTPILLESAIDSSRPEYSIGIQINIPLDFGLTSRLREAWTKEALAADLDLSRKYFEVDQEWNDLIARFDAEKRQLKISQSIEEAQRQKYEAEKGRFSVGKSDTYTVIMFEQDYMRAQFVRLQRWWNLFEVYTRLKLFRSDDESP